MNTKLRLEEDICLAENDENPLLVFVETNSRQTLEYGVLNALSEWELPEMIEGLSTAQNVCKYDLSILEAFLIDACRYATTIAKEFAKASPRKSLRRLPMPEHVKSLHEIIGHQSD